jgi:hypothetical protein
MIRGLTKKGQFVVCITVFYFSTVILGALCNSADQTDHMSHQKQGMHHSLPCLLACANMVSQDGEIFTLPSVLPVVGLLLSSIPFILFQTFTSILRSRGPPLSH